MAVEMLQIRKLADKSEGERVSMLRIPVGELRAALEGHDDDDHIVIDPAEFEQILFNPATPEVEHEPWPLAGIAFASNGGEIRESPPKRTVISTTKVQEGLVEGWIQLVGQKIVYAPAGPAEDPLRSTHAFRQADAVIFRTVDGDVRYDVTRNPGKYLNGKPSDEAGNPDAEVLWSYELKLAPNG